MPVGICLLFWTARSGGGRKLSHLAFNFMHLTILNWFRPFVPEWILEEYLDSPIAVSFGFAFAAFTFTGVLIDAVSPYFIQKGLTGRDLLKKDKPVMYELC